MLLGSTSDYYDGLYEDKRPQIALDAASGETLVVMEKEVYG